MCGHPGYATITVRLEKEVKIKSKNDLAKLVAQIAQVLDIPEDSLTDHMPFISAIRDGYVEYTATVKEDMARKVQQAGNPNALEIFFHDHQMPPPPKPMGPA